MVSKEDFLASLEKKSRTREQLAAHLGYRKSWTKRMLEKYKDDIVIVGYEAPFGRGKHAPIYGKRTSPEQQNAPLVKKRHWYIPVRERVHVAASKPTDMRLDMLLCGRSLASQS